MAFNEFATPTVATERLKLYLDIGTSASSPTWELEGRGVKSNSIDTGVDISNDTDVLGIVDVTVSKPKPTMEMEFKIRKGTVLGEKAIQSFRTRTCVLENQTVILKYEFLDAGTSGSTALANCKADKETDCTIALTNISAEAGDYITCTATLYFSNSTIEGYMPKTDGESISWTEGEPS